jgi:2-isopropylmalate synthase
VKSTFKITHSEDLTKTLGFQFDRNDIDILYAAFLQVADTKKEVMEQDLQALATAHAAVLVH